MDYNVTRGCKTIKSENVAKLVESPPPTRLEKIEYKAREIASWFPLILFYAVMAIIMGLLSGGGRGSTDALNGFTTGFIAGHTAVIMGGRR